jgi:hypothetical protein
MKIDKQEDDSLDDVAIHSGRLSDAPTPLGPYKLTVFEGVEIDRVPHMTCSRFIMLDLTNLSGNIHLPYDMCVLQDGSPCDGLLEVLWPSGLQSIGMDCFCSSGLVSVDLRGTQVRKLGGRAFAWCRRLGILHTPATLEVIEWGCFQYCALRTVQLDHCRKLRTVDRDAFSNCCRLCALIWPVHRFHMSYCACSNCGDLQEMELGRAYSMLEERSGSIDWAAKRVVLRTDENIGLVYCLPRVIANASFVFSGLVGARGRIIRPIPPAS